MDQKIKSRYCRPSRWWHWSGNLENWNGPPEWLRGSLPSGRLPCATVQPSAYITGTTFEGKKRPCKKNMVFQSSCSSSLFKMKNSVHVRMYVCTYARMHVCTYVRMYVCTYGRMDVCTYVRMYVCTYVRMYVCMYVDTYVYMHACMYALLPNTKRRPRPLPWIINTCSSFFWY